MNDNRRDNEFYDDDKRMMITEYSIDSHDYT